jgi:hypothetical protein
MNWGLLEKRLVSEIQAADVTVDRSIPGYWRFTSEELRRLLNHHASADNRWEYIEKADA